MSLVANFAMRFTVQSRKTFLCAQDNAKVMNSKTGQLARLFIVGCFIIYFSVFHVNEKKLLLKFTKKLKSDFMKLFFIVLLSTSPMLSCYILTLIYNIYSASIEQSDECLCQNPCRAIQYPYTFSMLEIRETTIDKLKKDHPIPPELSRFVDLIFII